MLIRQLIFAALLMCGLSGAARAADWALVALDGGARSFVNGEWKALRAGDTILRDHDVESQGRLSVTRGGAALDAAPGAKFRVEGETYTLVRLFEGSLSARLQADKDRPFLLMTTYAQITTEGAAFDVTTEPFGAEVVVREGAVEATDLTTRVGVEVKQGQVLHLRAGRTGEPATLANASTFAPSDKPAPEVSTKIVERNPFSTGGIRSISKGDALLAEEELLRLRDEKRKANVGKADARTFAVAAAITRELFEDFQYEPEPWDNNFQWTQVENGERRLKPLWRIFAQIEAPESYEFWTLIFVVCLFLGAFSTTITETSGFGVAGSTALVIFAFALAILVRDLFLRNGPNISMEPWLTLGLMIAGMTAALLGGVAARHRLP